MAEIVKTMKLHLHADHEADQAFKELTSAYADACNYVSQYVFEHGMDGFLLNSNKLQEKLYYEVREKFSLKSQLAVSVFKTVTARYKTVQTQLQNHPYICKVSEEGEPEQWIRFSKTLEWLQKPVLFSRPQADLVRGRDYSFVNGQNMISLNTMGNRIKLEFDKPEYFSRYFSEEWKFGTGKLVNLKGEWYFHIPVSKTVEETFDASCPKHLVGIDRGLRFLLVAYDEKGSVTFIDGQEILRKREQFAKIRAELQAKGTKSAKRALKRISGRENRWMTDVNHQLSKALVREYGEGTLFVLEDLTEVSFASENLNRSADGNRELRSWSFYQLEQFLEYKAAETGSTVIKVDPSFTSQRCPKCGRIHKQNRKHAKHEYVCDACGYRSNDDRVGAMNIYELGKLYVSGDSNPRFGARRTN